MKTTLEIPDTIFRRAKSVAAERGIPLREFVTEAVKDKLAANAKSDGKPCIRRRSTRRCGVDFGYQRLVGCRPL